MALAEAIERFAEVERETRKVRALDRGERRLEAAMARAFRAQGKAFLDRIEAERAPGIEAMREADEGSPLGAWEGHFDEAALETFGVFERPIDAAVRTSLMTGARQSIAELDVDLAFDLSNPRAAAYAETRAAESVTRINEVTRSELRRVIGAGVRDSQTVDETARTIRALFGGWATPQRQLHIRSRAHLIAVTETAGAYEAGNRAVADELVAHGMRMEKSWLTVGDGRVDADCVENTSVGWIPLSADFPAGAANPPQHPACRCTALYRRAQESSE